MKIKHIKINNKGFKKWRKKHWKEIDILIFGDAYEDEKGNRIDPMKVSMIYDEKGTIKDILKNENKPKIVLKNLKKN